MEKLSVIILNSFLRDACNSKFSSSLTLKNVIEVQGNTVKTYDHFLSAAPIQPTTNEFETNIEEKPVEEEHMKKFNVFMPSSLIRFLCVM